MMTNHPENLVAWLDDELTAEQAEAVTLHVEGCPECRARAQAYAAVSDGLVELRARPERIGWRRWSLAAAGVAAAVLVTVGMWSIRSTPGPVTAQVPVPPPAPAAKKTEMQMFFRANVAPPPAPKVVRKRPKVEQPVMGEVMVVPVSLSMDEYLPPGAIPAGFSVRAEMVLAEDGTARELRLMP